jgi:hypothetical protein
MHSSTWTLAKDTTSLVAKLGNWVSVMPYSGLMPSLEAIQQAMLEPMLRAPLDHKEFAIYIFEGKYDRLPISRISQSRWL